MTANHPTPDFSLDGQVALVTGATRGIGASICVALAAAGADVIVGQHHPGTGLDVIESVDALGRRATGRVVDVLDLDASRASIDAAIADHDRIDILVNNAGGGIDQDAIDVTETAFHHVMAHNVTSTMFLSQHVAGHMIDRGGGGRIINMCSQAGVVALPGETSYCVAKAAVAHLTRCLAVEWGRHGITVNAISPTFIETDGTAEALADDEFRADTVGRIAALNRIGQPVDVAGAAVFLASSAAGLITGHNLVVDGGWTIR